MGLKFAPTYSKRAVRNNFADTTFVINFDNDKLFTREVSKVVLESILKFFRNYTQRENMAAKI